jgi:P27 family predicted phage terminase small subunit
MAKPQLTAIEGGGIPEPIWSQVFNDEIDIELAKEQWRLIVNELKATEKLAACNSHQVKRLAIAYVQYEVALRHVVEQGAVTLSKKGNQVYNLWWTVMQQAGGDAANLEAELTISPRRRSNGGKAQKGKAQAGGASAYLHKKP